MSTRQFVNTVNTVNTVKEMIMSQKVPESSNVKTPPAPEQKRQEQPITDVSPHDPFPIDPTGTGKPGQPEK